jgi:hypothetical protein
MNFSGCPGTKSALPPTWPVSVPAAAYPLLTAAASAGYGIVPPRPPLPAACTLRFHPDAGSHTSIRMSESGEGVSFAVMRQNAGSVLNTAAAAALFPEGGANAPAWIVSADVTVPFCRRTCDSDSHATGAAATRVPVSNRLAARTAATPNRDTIFMVGLPRSPTSPSRG